MSKYLYLLGRRIYQCAQRFYENEDGQGTVEYLLILSASAVGTVSLTRALLNVLDTGILTLGGQLEQDLKTGRAPLSVWDN